MFISTHDATHSACYNYSSCLIVWYGKSMLLIIKEFSHNQDHTVKTLVIAKPIQINADPWNSMLIDTMVGTKLMDKIIVAMMSLILWIQ